MVRLTAPETEYLESTAQAEVRVAGAGPVHVVGARG